MFYEMYINYNIKSVFETAFELYLFIRAKRIVDIIQRITIENYITHLKYLASGFGEVSKSFFKANKNFIITISTRQTHLLMLLIMTSPHLLFTQNMPF